MRIRPTACAAVLLLQPFGCAPAPPPRPCDCGPALLLPAYSHNDYRNARPLQDALALGYRGVEADVFLVDGRLVVAHGRRQARSAPSFEDLYLRPLEERAARCGGRIYAQEPRPFLLHIEAKENDSATFEAIESALASHAALFTGVRDGVRLEGPVEAILVGHHPPAESLAARSPRLFALQFEVERPEDLDVAHPGDLVRLVSLDFGRTLRRLGGGPLTPRAARILRSLERAKRAWPGVLFRVHDVPADGPAYDHLLAAGVDLIGTKNLAATHRILVRRAALPRRERDR